MKFKLIESQTKYYVKHRKLETTKISNHLKTTKIELLFTYLIFHLLFCLGWNFRMDMQLNILGPYAMQ